MRKIRIFAHISLDGVISPGDRRRQRLRAWRMDGTVSNSGRGSGPRRGTGQELRSAAWPPHLRSLGRLLAEGQGRSVRGRSERRDEIRRDPQAGEPRMGSGRRPRRGHHGRYSRHQVKGRPRPDRLGKFDPDVRAARAGTGRRGCADRLPGLAGPGQTLLFGQCRPARTRFRQHEGHAHGRAHEHLSTRWIAANPTFADVSG